MLRAITITFVLAACGSKSNPAPPSSGSGSAPAGGACVVGGCSGTICSDRNDMMSTCEYKAEYGCYKTASCGRQADGQCGWTQSAELTACLANPPPMTGPAPQ